MCDCREKFEEQAAKHYPDIENAKAMMAERAKHQPK